jgi:hypothetical protein
MDANDTLTASAKELLQSSVNDYGRYMDHLGFTASSQPKVRVVPDEEMDGWLSNYNPNTGDIRIANTMIHDVDSPRREYTNHVLQRVGDDPLDEYLYLIRSDLADYFMASFAYRPELHAGTSVARTLDNQTIFDGAQPASGAWREGRGVWGGAFWAIRSALGPQAADQILAATWRRMPKVSADDGTPATFITALMDVCDDVASSDAKAQIAKVLRQRKFPIPKSL